MNFQVTLNLQYDDEQLLGHQQQVQNLARKFVVSHALEMGGDAARFMMKGAGVDTSLVASVESLKQHFTACLHQRIGPNQLHIGEILEALQPQKVSADEGIIDRLYYLWDPVSPLLVCLNFIDRALGSISQLDEVLSHCV